MLNQDRLQEAISSFKRAAAIRDDWAEPWFYAAVAHERAGEPDLAITALERAIDRDPGYIEAACRLGDLLRDKGETVKAVIAYEQALASQNDNIRAITGRADALRILGKHEEAQAGFEQALRIDPDDFSALCGMAATMNAIQRFETARKFWERARELAPQSDFVSKGMAVAELGLKDGLDRLIDDVAEEALPSFPVVTPDDRKAMARQVACDELDRGRSYHKEHKHAAAITCFQRALEFDPTFAEAALRLGMAYEDDRQFRRAIDAYERCLSIEKDQFQAATNIGEAYRKNEQYHEAIDAYDKALLIRSDYLYALAGRAECMRMLGNYEESLEWFDKALAIGGNHAFAIQGKAAALNALQRFADAVEYWDRALNIEPQSQFALDGKSYCEAQLRRTEKMKSKLDAPMSTPATSTTPTLDEQGRDLTALAARGELPQVIGREQEIRSVMKTLVRRLKANPILLGEPGVGKTAVVEGLAQLISAGEVPDKLKGLRLVELSMGTLVAGTKYRGTFEERLREIIKEATSVPGMVLFIDEIHTLVGAGRTEGGSLDAANILKPALARGEITVIGATTRAEFRQHFESDSALERRFQPIEIDEPSEAECIELLTRVSGKYESHHGVTVDASAIEACVKMSIRFVPDRRLPDKALDMLDESCAECSLSDESTVTSETVAKVVSERTGVPLQELTSEERERIQRIDKSLAERVLGQPQAIQVLANSIRMSTAGLRAPQRPRGILLFQGPSGVGKTELAKAMSEQLFPEGDALIRLDMSEYSDRYTYTRLTGPPPGYAGHGEEGLLTGPLRRKPYAVVLLDDFDKAHPDVQNVFLSLFDEGTIQDAEGRHVSAKDAYFILTTCAGSERKGGGRMGFNSTSSRHQQKEAVLEDLKAFIRPELLDRIDDVVSFEKLKAASITSIVSLNLKKFQARAAERGVHIQWTPAVPRFLTEHCDHGSSGARAALRAIETFIGDPLGAILLQSAASADRRYRVSVKEGKIVVTEERPAIA